MMRNILIGLVLALLLVTGLIAAWSLRNRPQVPAAQVTTNVPIANTTPTPSNTNAGANATGRLQTEDNLDQALQDLETVDALR